MCEAHFLKPDGERGQSLALKRDPATQVTKAKRDIQLKQGNHLLHNDVFRGCHARSKQVREESLQSRPTSLFTGPVSVLLQQVVSLLQPLWHPRCSECCFEYELSSFLVSRQQGQCQHKKSGAFSRPCEHSPATTYKGPSSLSCPWQGDLKHTLHLWKDYLSN